MTHSPTTVVAGSLFGVLLHMSHFYMQDFPLSQGLNEHLPQCSASASLECKTTVSTKQTKVKEGQLNINRNHKAI